MGMEGQIIPKGLEGIQSTAKLNMFQAYAIENILSPFSLHFLSREDVSDLSAGILYHDCCLLKFKRVHFTAVRFFLHVILHCCLPVALIGR